MKYEIFGETKTKIDENYLAFLKTRVKEKKFEIGEDSLNAVFDSENIDTVFDITEKFNTPELSHIFVVGIGGSSLGSKAVYGAYFGKNDSDQKRKIFWLESVDADLIKQAEKTIGSLSSKNNLAIIIASKSGATTETLANAGIVLSFCEKKWGDVSDRIVVITDANTTLHKWAEENSVEFVLNKKSIGGRYSVFSPFGLLPLSLAGFPVRDFISGGIDAVDQVGVDNFSSVFANSVFNSYEEGTNIVDFFVFSLRYNSLGLWYRQLLSESLGKDRDIDNNKIKKGILPTVSVGTDDLHSVLQLYLSDSGKRFTIFIKHLTDFDYKIEAHSIFKKYPFLSGKNTSEIKNAIFNSVLDSYKDEKLPFINIDLDKENIAKDLGYFMQSIMISTMMLAHMMKVNAFNQPKVENYKNVTRKILEK